MVTEAQELGKYTPVPDMLILAAVQRAERHGPKPPLPHRIVGAHLGFKNTAPNSRLLLPRLKALRDAGSLASSRKFGKDRWTLSRSGRSRLAAARRKGEVGELPESPQHREWRHAREEAAKRIVGFKEHTRDLVEEADRKLVDAKHPTADELLSLSRRFEWAFWLLGSATYCLHEWPEPDDAKMDSGEHRDRPFSRRSVVFWDKPWAGDKEAQARP